MNKWIVAFLLLTASGLLLIAPSILLAQSDPTLHACTKDQADGKVYDDAGWNQDLKCRMGKFYRYQSYDAVNDKYYCILSEPIPVDCSSAPVPTAATPSPSPSSTSSATPSALPISGLSFQEEGRLNLAVRRLTPSGFSLPTSGCQLPMLNAYIGAAESVECPGGNAVQNAMSNASLKFAQAVLPPNQFLASKPPENQNLLERFRHWLFRTLVSKAFGIGGS
ncbi:MAG: hypothetical protein Q8R11_02870 [bacterium]|nr:hypothetical protein [bacterium]